MATIPITGTKVGGKYELREKVSEGGGGVVWKAGGDAGAEIALKILKLSALHSKDAITDRFKREFELFKKVSHPNIAKIYDFGYDADLDIYYFTSELLTGGDLRKLIGAPVPEIEIMLLQSLRALEYLRSFGILHLDIKPQNLLLRKAGDKRPAASDALALIDFGLAGFNPPERPGGTPNYMPPEVAARRLEGSGKKLVPIDHRSDLYSLGVTFYYVLSGVQPFAVTGSDGRLDTTGTMRRHMSEERPKPPSSHNPDVPKYLDDIIMRMMAKEADERYQTAILAAQALSFRSPNRLEPESRETLSAYLPEEGMMIGRHAERETIERVITDTVHRTGDILPVVCIVGGWGTGKTRLLKSLKPFAQQQEMEVVENLRYETLDVKRATAFLIDDPFLPQASIDIASIPDIYAFKRLVRFILQMPKARFFLAFTLNPDLMPTKEMLRQMELSPELCTVIELKDFTTEEINEYLAHLLGEPPSEKIVEELYDATFGNPRFIVEFFKRMMKRGEFFSYFTGRPGAQTLESMGFSFSHAASPPSLAEHLLDLVKALPRGAKTMARRLACWQRSATVEEMVNLGGDTADGDLADMLASGLVRRNEEDGTFSFVNPLAPKIVEVSLDPKERAAIHDSIVEYLKRVSPGESFEIDRHLVFGSNDELKFASAERVPMEALKRLHPAEAAETLRAMYSVIPEEKWEIRARILVREGQALERVGRWNDAKTVFEQIKNLSKDDSAMAKLTVRSDEQLGLMALRRRDLSSARSTFAKLKSYLEENKFAKRPDFQVTMLRLENYLAAVDLREGKYEGAAKAYAVTAKKAEKLSKEDHARVTNNELGEALVYTGDLKEAFKVLDRELEWAKANDHRDRVVSRLRLLGDASRRSGDYAGALSFYESALKASQDYHLFEHQLRIRNSFANLLLQMGKWSEAIEQYKPALDLSMQLEGKATSVDIMANIGLAYNKLGKFDDAIEYMELALDFAKGPEAESSAAIRKIIPQIHVALGHAHYERRQLDEARKHLMIALDQVADTALDDITLYNLHGTLAEIDIAAGRPADAEKRLPVLKDLASKIPEAKKHFDEISIQVEGALKDS